MQRWCSSLTLFCALAALALGPRDAAAQRDMDQVFLTKGSPSRGMIADNGVNATAFDEKAITLSATAENLEVVAGDVLALFSEAVGSGLADPGGTIQVTINRSYA